jgi:TQXA domain-containing protein
VLVAVALATGLRAVPTLAADATLTSLGAGLYNAVVGTTGGPTETFSFAGAFHITIDGGAPTDAYCVDIHHPLSVGDTEPQTPPDYPCEVVYILTHAYPNPGGIGSQLADLNREAAAVQAAIWHFTDAFTITAPADVQSRTAEIINIATSQCVQVPPVPQTLTLSPDDAINYLPGDQTHSATATLLDTNGQPIADYPLDVTIAGAAGPQTFHGFTDAQGELTITYDNTFLLPGIDTITARASFTVPLGLKFKLEGKQGIVLAGAPRPGTVTGTATKHWVPVACGDGAVNQPGEECDDGNDVDDDGCDGNCTQTSCGNGIVTEGEQCDDGNLLDGDGCDFTCTPTGCGNGVVTVGEACDDGNAVNGDECDNNCTPPLCGNGVATAGEQCDDGNATNGDSCDTNCTITACGNGVVTAGEQCDDGNAVNGDGCDATCTVTACGNGIVTAGEQCDDGNAVNGDSCDNKCTAPGCGNGVVSTGEQCDDGNQADGDGCDNNCTLTGCGNGVVTAGERCDDGNVTSGDACDANCTFPTCGNGVVTAGELCDDGNDVDGDGCDHDCSVTACGNGMVTAGEECDDGNQADGDLCESNCTVASCSNGIVDQGEQCDDANQIDGDGCDGACHLREICTNTADDDGDGAVDCDDTDCNCLPILEDPAVIKLIADGPDFFRIHGFLQPQSPCDPLSEGLSIVVTNGNGVIYKAQLRPGDLVRRWSSMVFVDKPAKRGRGARDGLYRVKLLRGREGRIGVTLEAFGDFSAATLPAMTVQIGIGDDMFFNKAAWSPRRYGWHLIF